ncbi:MAG TPA: S8 family serine peptidase [Plantibacter sp.]|uniref:S8 family serine peptidase n=1 Tax=Plantibacter sp. TaxID=1871045 RepID=UPI002B646155|nr:S8 family serine peptidase [Plantibacter sp.]
MECPALDPLGAGAGVRLALIDSGVNAQHPFFDATGYATPAGYPKAQRVSGGVRTDLPLATYASNKVIVGNVYPYPGNTTATPLGPRLSAGTHVGGIMAGNDRTYNYTSGPATFALQFSGMAPGVYLMSYRLDGDSAEFIAAIEDVVADQADALNISLGHSRWLTTDPAHDPIRDALDAAVDAGTIVVGSSGNAGANGDSSITGSWKLSPKVITVANSTHARVFSNAVSATGPGTPPASLRSRPGVPGGAPTPPIGTTISGEYVVAPGGVGPNAGEACAPLPAGSLAGKILLAARGTCGFDIKKANALNAGAIAYIVHNNSPDPPISMGGITAPAIPGVMVTLADGRGLVAWASTNPAPTVDIEGPLKRLTSGWPDVVSGSSSRGPAPTMGLKPDIAAPGSNVLSSVVNDTTGAVNPAGLFEQVSGTSMASPHITALAGLTKALHPSWTPAQVKSALMNTASTSMSLDLEGTIPALAKHRGAGRVNAARLVGPQLTFDPPSVSFGLMRLSEAKQVTITATDVRENGGSIGYAVSTRAVGASSVTLGTQSFSSAPAGSATFTVDLSTAGATPGDHEGFIEVTGGGQTYTIPYFVRVQDPGVAKDVLLIDWDRNLGGVDFRPVYEAALTGLGLSYDVFNGGLLATANGNPGPTFAQLQNYRAVVFFTGNNLTSWSVAHVGGSFPLEDYLVAGGSS